MNWHHELNVSSICSLPGPAAIARGHMAADDMTRYGMHYWLGHLRLPTIYFKCPGDEMLTLFYFYVRLFTHSQHA